MDGKIFGGEGEEIFREENELSRFGFPGGGRLGGHHSGMGGSREWRAGRYHREMTLKAAVYLR